MAKASDKTDPVIRAAFDLAARLGWRHVSLADIAGESKLSLAKLYDRYRSKTDILIGFTRAIDAAVLAGTGAPSEDESVRDRLFDTLMRRFEALGPYREGLAAVLRDGAGGPAALLCGGASLLRSMAWTLESVGVGSNGFKGRLRTKGLLVVYLSSLRVWLRDETEDLAPTMAALDRRLARAETLAKGGLPGWCPRRRETTGEEAPQS
ncbi:MAG: TetR family transcriptional regulator [Alphaproteobacteria bacterium]|nr:TetR family transcriptional regulator [Alphaproteobacteria bacterium]